MAEEFHALDDLRQDMSVLRGGKMSMAREICIQWTTSQDQDQCNNSTPRSRARDKAVSGHTCSACRYVARDRSKLPIKSVRSPFCRAIHELHIPSKATQTVKINVKKSDSVTSRSSHPGCRTIPSRVHRRRATAMIAKALDVKMTARVAVGDACPLILIVAVRQVALT